MKKISHWYLVALVWGVLSAILSLVVLKGQHVGVPLVLRVVLDLVTVAIVFLAGRKAKQQGAKPVGVGAVIGLIFGVVSGWPVFFVRVTRAQLVHSLHGRAVSPVVLAATLKYSNSAIGHIVSWLAVLIVSVLLSLIGGAIGGATVRNRTSADDV